MPPFGIASIIADNALFCNGFSFFVRVFFLVLQGGHSAVFTELPATVVYPIVTGGSIIFTMLAGWLFFHEKPNRKMLAAVGISFLGTCLFL